MSEGGDAGRIVARLVPGEMLRPEDAAQIEAEVRRRLDEGIDELVPRLARLMRRPEWGLAERREYKREVEVMIAGVLEWARQEMKRVALPGVHRDPDESA